MMVMQRDKRANLWKATIFSRRGTFEILSRLEKNPMRFSEIYSVFKGSPATLSSRLRQLEMLKAIHRDIQVEPGKAITVSYVITEKGKKALAAYRNFVDIVSE